MQSRSVLASLALISLSGVAVAEPLRVHGSLGAGHALSGPQKHEYAWGAGAWLALEYPLVKQLGLELSGSWIGLGQGDPPVNPRVVPETGASSAAASFGFHVIPFAG